MSESNTRAWKMIGMSFVAPMGLYFLIFHHWRCETGPEQITALVLVAAGFGAAMKWA